MPTLAEIGQHLEDQAIVTVGTDMFLAHLPSADEATDNIAVMYEYISEEPIQCMGPSLTAPKMIRPRVHVMVQNTSYAAAVLQAKAIYDVLHNFKGTLSSVVYYWIQALQEPFSLGHDEKERSRIACNYRIHKDPS